MRTRKCKKAVMVASLTGRMMRQKASAMVRNSVPYLLGQCTQVRALEFCYNVRYIEQNGRDRGDPWSLRQMGVYHGFDWRTHSSIWIVLQPSDYVLATFEDTLQAMRALNLIQGGHHLLHLFFLSSLERKWKDYVESLRLNIEILVGMMEMWQTAL